MLILGSDLGLMEMTEADYAHLQHLIQVHMEAQAGPPDGPDDGSYPAVGISPSTATQAIDLSTSSEEYSVLMPGYVEKTPTSYGDVPDFVLAKIRGEDGTPNSSSSRTPHNKSRSTARVCLEKKFNAISTDMPRPQNLQSAVLNNVLTILQQNTEAQEDVIQTEMQKWIKTESANPVEVSSPYVGDVFSPVTNTCGQVIGHIPYIIEPNIHQGFIIPKRFSFNFHPERIAAKAHCMSSSSLIDEQQLLNIQSETATPAASKKNCCSCNSQRTKTSKVADSAADAGCSTRKRAQSCVSLNQRKERHNSKERERRKRIRLYCDELNMLVPFCNLDTDKVTTLQWTTAYLTYLNKTYGDTLKEEFQKSFTDEKGLLIYSNPSRHDNQKMDKTLSAPLDVEQ